MSVYRFVPKAKMHNLKVLVVKKGDIPYMEDFFKADIVLEQQNDDSIFQVTKVKDKFPKLGTKIKVLEDINDR